MNLDLKNTLEETAALIQSPFYLFDTDGGMHHLQYDGPGIPEEYRDAVFEPFVVGDESRTSGKGTGP